MMTFFIVAIAMTAVALSFGLVSAASAPQRS